MNYKDKSYTKKSHLYLLSLFFSILLLSVSLFGCSHINKYTVIFDTRGGSKIQSVSIQAGDKISKPIDPTKDGYIFDGWYVSNTDFSEDNKWSFIGYSVTEDMTLYAKWIVIDGIKVNFDLDGGTGNTNELNVVFDSTYGNLPSAIIKTGYKFAGWWTEKNGNGSEIQSNSIVKIAADHTLYAKWVKLFDGEGTISAPYLITSVQVFKDFAEQVQKGEQYRDLYFELKTDIDLNGIEWTPAGSGEDGFCGNFNGNGHIISNYKITRDGTYIGLFGSTNGGTIVNLCVSNFTIHINSTYSIIYAGGLVGANSVYSSLGETTIRNCSILGKIYVAGAEATAGGIAGKNGGAIINCFSNVEIISYSKSTNYSCYAGGLVGQNSGSAENCVAIGDICAKKDNRYQYVSNSYAGTLFGSGNSNSNPNYYFENQVVVEQVGANNSEYTKNGLSCSKSDLENINFYLNTLGWDNHIWALENLNIENGKYPTLIKN